MTAYRSGRTLGVFATLVGPAGAALFEELTVSLDGLRAESGLALTLSTSASDPFRGSLEARCETGDDPQLWSDERSRAWLVDAANRMVNLLRPRLAQGAAGDALA